MPVNPKQTVQSQTLPDPVEGVTLPVREEEKNNQLIGYVRASESLVEVHKTLRQLDLG